MLTIEEMPLGHVVRLIQIQDLLLSRGEVNLTHLSEETGWHRKTIQRDVGRLRSLGARIEAVGHHGGVEIRKSVDLRKAVRKLID